jgi:REP element-mobilizing transposase RayT
MNSRYTNLPHLNLKGYYQFITFRTYDSLDEYIKKISQKDISNSKKQYLIDNHLDNSSKGAYLNGKILNFMYNFLLLKDKDIYELISFVIMSNHIHLLVKPSIDLDKMVKIIKGGSAYHINKMLNIKGKFWANNYYDRAIRDEKHFFKVYEYIRNNPLKVGKLKNQFSNRFYGIYG